MAISTYNTVIKGSVNRYIFGETIYTLKTFLKSVGWTVAGSSDGTSGGMDGVDRITTGMVWSRGSEALNPWIVLQSPHALAADRIQILFRPTAANTSLSYDHYGTVSYNPSADWVSTSTSLPTSASAVRWENGSTGVLSTYGVDVRFHILAQTTAPYGFALLGTKAYDATVNAEFTCILAPLSTTSLLNPGKPYALIASQSGVSVLKYSELSKTSNSTTSCCLIEPPNPPQAPVQVPACYLSNAGGVLAPNGASTDSQNRDLSFPIIFQSVTVFGGVSDFIRWNGRPRNKLDTMSDVTGDRGRICLADINLPWDGTTVPLQ